MNNINQLKINWQTPKPLSPDSSQEQQQYPIDCLPEIIKAPVIAYQTY
jgi:hypothetical protein